MKAIESLIFTIRGQRVILDADLAALYGVDTRSLNQAVKRNEDRFPDDFSFRISRAEWENLQSQLATSSAEPVENTPVADLRSQFVTSSGEPTLRSQIVISKENRSQIVTGSKGGRRYFPRAFTEHGAIMAASVLNSPEAISMSVYVVRAFVLMREQLAANSEIFRRLAEIDKKLIGHDTSLQVLWSKLQPLLVPQPEQPKRRIGFSKDKA